ncbi:MAG: hypothetical protein OHK93_001301, partial [Ramalina farinacea]|nr:hypothetical protein [Ramalina farinacea]
MPSFSIEAPGEANPMTPDTVYRALLSAASNDQHQIQTGTQQLKNWETTPGFFSTVQSFYIDLSLPYNVRYLTSILLKQAVDKYWRKASDNAIGRDEKNLIRQRALESLLNEPEDTIALHTSIFVARIVRIEYPLD